jgi:predicted transcriptional regulator
MIVSFKGFRDLKADLIGALKSKKAIQPKNSIYFDSPQSFRNFMTLQKIELLAMIAHAEPKSIYDLAKIVDRALDAVQKDCQMLEGSGFIKFDKQKTGRGSIVPKLKFDYNRIVVQLPDHPYSLRIEAA